MIKKIFLTAVKKGIEASFKSFKDKNLSIYFNKYVNNTLGENNRQAKKYKIG